MSGVHIIFLSILFLIRKNNNKRHGDAVASASKKYRHSVLKKMSSSSRTTQTFIIIFELSKIRMIALRFHIIFTTVYESHLLDWLASTARDICLNRYLFRVWWIYNFHKLPTVTWFSHSMNAESKNIHNCHLTNSKVSQIISSSQGWHTDFRYVIIEIRNQDSILFFFFCVSKYIQACFILSQSV